MSEAPQRIEHQANQPADGEWSPADEKEHMICALKGMLDECYETIRCLQLEIAEANGYRYVVNNPTTQTMMSLTTQDTALIKIRNLIEAKLATGELSKALAPQDVAELQEAIKLSHTPTNSIMDAVDALKAVGKKAGDKTVAMTVGAKMDYVVTVAFMPQEIERMSADALAKAIAEKTKDIDHIIDRKDEIEVTEIHSWADADTEQAIEA